jgi:hypothetical protein
VNAIGRWLPEIDYLVMVDRPGSFPPEKAKIVKETKVTRYLFFVGRDRNGWESFFPHNGVPFPSTGAKHARPHTEWYDWRLPKTCDPVITTYDGCPFAACMIAGYLGAKKISLIGVDYDDDGFWRKRPMLDDMWGKLRDYLQVRGVAMENMSPDSRLESIPKVSRSAEPTTPAGDRSLGEPASSPRP